MEKILDFVRELAEPKFQELAIIPSHVIIPCLQRFEMAPYKFSRVKLNDAFIFEDDEAIFYVKNEYSWKHDYYVSQYGMYFVTRKSGRLYHAVLTDKSFPEQLHYYTSEKTVSKTLNEYVRKKFGVYMTCYTLGVKKSTWKPLHEANIEDVKEDYIQQGSLELLRVQIDAGERSKLYSYYLDDSQEIPEISKEATRIYNHEFTNGNVYRFKNSEEFFFVIAHEDGKVKSSDHEDVNIEKGFYIAYHPVPRDDVD